MAKQTEEQKLMHRWWILVLIALVFLGLGYGFFYLATDSGSLWQYAICIIFVVWAVKYIVRGARLAFSR
ncbi:MAG TPA: hypothetical protein VFB03_01645 [Candidatus Saccharimonadales bacterium]|nr:hypothetical protein [Candidatus Saccharimonadales bacterium]